MKGGQGGVDTGADQLSIMQKRVKDLCFQEEGKGKGM